MSEGGVLGTGDGRVLDLITRAPSAFRLPMPSRHAIFVPKTLDRWGTRIIRRIRTGVTVADRISDSIHANVDIVAVQVIQLAVELAHLGIEGFER